MNKQLFGALMAKKTDHVICFETDESASLVSMLCARNGENIGAVSPVAGSGDIKNTDWTPLCGKTVYLWPETTNSELRMLAINEILNKLTPIPVVLKLDTSSIKGTAREYLERLDEEEQLEQVKGILSNSTLSMSRKVGKRIEDAISGKRETVKLPWHGLHYSTYALKPGTVTLLCGQGGAAKSFCLLQMCQYWHFDLGHKVALYELEEDKEFHLMRALAQCSKQPKITDEEWVKDHPKEAREIYTANGEFLERMGQIIQIAPLESVSLKELAKWVDKQARSGKRIICIDPITAASQGKEVWIEDRDFIMSAKRSVERHGASLVIVTHPKKGGGSLADMDNLAGGSCWQRFSQTILWLKNPGKDTEVDVLIEGCKMKDKCNRIMAVLKARNASGGGNNFAMNLENVLFEEVGLVVREKK